MPDLTATISGGRLPSPISWNFTTQGTFLIENFNGPSDFDDWFIEFNELGGTVIFRAVGGGGGGSSGQLNATASAVGGGGGGGGGVNRLGEEVTVVAGVYTLRIGAGGAGGAGNTSVASGANGSAGGDTVILAPDLSTILICEGGNGGGNGGSSSAVGGDGGSASGINGINGGDGGNGGSLGGNGDDGQTSLGCGGGGGGGSSATAFGLAGGNGGNGGDGQQSGEAGGSGSSGGSNPNRWTLGGNNATGGAGGSCTLPLTIGTAGPYGNGSAGTGGCSVETTISQFTQTAYSGTAGAIVIEEGEAPPINSIIIIGSGGVEVSGEADYEVEAMALSIIGSGGVEVSGAASTVLSVDISGIYQLTPGLKHDTLYARDSGVDTIDVKIPRPFIKTAYLGY